MLHLRGEDHLPVVDRHAARQVVEGVGGVAHDHGDVVWPGADERADPFPRGLVHGGGNPRGEARAAVHAGIPRERLGHGIRHRLHGGGTRRVVEIDVPTGAPGTERYLEVRVDERGHVERGNHQGAERSAMVWAAVAAIRTRS